MDALGINPWILLAQIINFILLFVILRAVAYEPIQKMLAERKERIETQMEDAEFAAQAKDEAEAQREEILAEARQEARTITAEANAQLEDLKKASREEANQQAKEILAEARQKAEEERDQMLGKVRGQISALAIAAAQQIIGEKLDEKRQRALVDSFFSSIGADSVEILEEMEPTDAPVTIVSAVTLSESEQKALLGDLAKHLGEDFESSFKVDPNLLGGLVVLVGDRVIDGSVSNQLNKLQETLV